MGLQWLGRWCKIEAAEARGVLLGFLVLFSLFTAYFMLRPVRETMGVVGGVSQLQWLFTATFVTTLLILPVVGWVMAHGRRRYLGHYVLVFFASNMVGFAVAFMYWAESVWLARIFFVWLSVFNLTAISLVWSVLADVFSTAQSKRAFALMAAGASLGGLFGPALAAMLVQPFGHFGLMVLAGLWLLLAVAFLEGLQRWREGLAKRAPLPQAEDRQRALGGGALAGVRLLWRSPLLLGIAVFVMLLASVNTFLYFEQARWVAAYFDDRLAQTQFFALIDMVVQGLSLLIQCFLTARIAAFFGLRALLLSVPILMVLGFVLLAVAPVFMVFVVVMVARRVGEYALVRPGREMLFTLVPVEAKYKAKNAIDTAVYRGADAVSGWLKSAADALFGSALAPVVGAFLALAWAASAWGVTRPQDKAWADQAEATKEEPPP
ncbi:MAG: MFS transporter [Neisseriaceae bacterium]|nr:MFS transporter [Neisseriaceae bacterium]